MIELTEEFLANLKKRSAAMKVFIERTERIRTGNYPAGYLEELEKEDEKNKNNENYYRNILNL